MPSLERAVAASRRASEERQARRPLAALEREVSALPPIRPFTEAIGGEEISFVLRLGRDDADVLHLSDEAEVAGVAISTETARGGDGELERLRRVAGATPLPVLHRDVLVDGYQVYESRLAGADGVVVVAAAFEDDDDGLSALYATAGTVGIDVVVEVGEEEEIEHVLELLDPESFLIRNYSDDDRLDFERTFSLLEEVPAGKVVLSDGGVRTRDDVVALERAGVDATVLGPWVLGEGLVPTLRMLRGEARG